MLLPFIRISRLASWPQLEFEFELDIICFSVFTRYFFFLFPFSVHPHSRLASVAIVARSFIHSLNSLHLHINCTLSFILCVYRYCPLTYIHDMCSNLVCCCCFHISSLVVVVVLFLIRSLVVATNINYSFIALFVFLFQVCVAGMLMSLIYLFEFCLILSAGCCWFSVCIHLQYIFSLIELYKFEIPSGVCLAEPLLFGYGRMPKWTGASASARFDIGGHRQYGWLCVIFVSSLVLTFSMHSLDSWPFALTLAIDWICHRLIYGGISNIVWFYSNIAFPGHVNAVWICHFSALVSLNSQINQAKQAIINNKP